MQENLNNLSTRKGFNTSLKHFKFVNKIIKKIEQKENLADLVNSALEDKIVHQYQFAPILNALLIDKFGYYSESVNLKSSNTNLSKLVQEIEGWDKFDIILSYFHPQLDQTLINPKSTESWETIDQLKENELLVIYIGNYNLDFDLDLAKKAVKALKQLINGEKPANTKIFKSGDLAESDKPEKKEIIKTVQKDQVKEVSKPPKEDIKVPQETNNSKVQPAIGAKNKMSPHYGVLVSNELFHNGNVEAWKKIIASYQQKYPYIKVMIFYEGEQIHDINTLFKWGKVKHGTNIYFALLGPDFTDVSKLRRYLAQGASNRFEDFLKGDPTKTLSLF